MSDEQEKSSDVEAAQMTAKEIIMRVRKLRWAGMDDEAERLLKDLEQPLAPNATAESVLPTRVETD